jgi:hypothetical protein
MQKLNSLINLDSQAKNLEKTALDQSNNMVKLTQQNALLKKQMKVSTAIQSSLSSLAEDPVASK